MSAKSNKIELSEKFMVIWKKEQTTEVFCKKDVLRNFAKFTRKRRCGKMWKKTFCQKSEMFGYSFI